VTLEMRDPINYAECDPQVIRLCETLRALRRRNGLTQASLAARSGVSQPEISRIERALTAPSYARLCTLLASLGAQLRLEANGNSVALTPAIPPKTKKTTTGGRLDTDRMERS
jgi:transcriptional regulator with XRE-family HTH domain